MPTLSPLRFFSRSAGALAVLALAAGPALAGEVEPGQWGERAPLLAPNSEFAVAELDGELYILGGYPADRVTVTTVQIYDTAADIWRYGPDLPAPNNHGMAAAVDGTVYLLGGQTDASGQDSYVDTVYALDPDVGEWEERARMPTRRSAGDRKSVV